MKEESPCRGAGSVKMLLFLRLRSAARAEAR